MASAHFLWKQFDEVFVYLNSIKSFFVNDDLFNFNYGQTLVQLENFTEAEQVLESITNAEFTDELPYQLSLARACKIIKSETFHIFKTSKTTRQKMRGNSTKKLNIPQMRLNFCDSLQMIAIS
jgi:hypothetical protein